MSSGEKKSCLESHTARFEVAVIFEDIWSDNAKFIIIAILSNQISFPRVEPANFSWLDIKSAKWQHFPGATQVIEIRVNSFSG